MSVFTDVAATLSFNFGNEAKMPKSHYDHVQLKDRTKEQKKYIKFLRSKVGIRCITMERMTNYILAYRESHNGDVSLEEISNETYADIKDLKKAMKLLTKYEKKKKQKQENIDYALNNPDQAEFGNTNISDISYAIFDTLAEDPEISNIIQSCIDSGIKITPENADILGAQILRDVIANTPGVYNSFREALKKSCKNLIEPFSTEESRKRKEGGEIAMEMINNPELNDGLNSKPDNSGSYVPNFSIPAQSPEDTMSAKDPSQEQTSQAQGSANQSDSQNNNEQPQTNSQDNQTTQQQQKGSKSKK